MNNIAMQRLHKLLIRTVFKSNAVVHSCVIYKAVNSSKLRDHFINHPLAFLWLSKLSSHLKSPAACGLNLSQCLLVILSISADNHRNSTLVCKSFYNTGTNTFGSATNYNYFIFKL